MLQATTPSAFRDKLRPIVMSGKEVHPIVEGGKGIGATSGQSTGAFAAAGCVGTFSGVNADSYDENGKAIPYVYKGTTRRDRHEELVDLSTRGAIAQAKIAHDISGGKGRIHTNVLWEMGGCERILKGLLEGAKGLVHGVTCGAGMPCIAWANFAPIIKSLLSSHHFFGARVQRAVETRLQQNARMAGQRRL